MSDVEDDGLKNEDPNTLPAFISKLVNIMASAGTEGSVQWGGDGTTISITDQAAFAANVIPKFFKHSNFASFVRQLNLYGFHKTTQDSELCEFQHKHFKRDQPHLMVNIKRKSTMEKPDKIPGSKAEVEDLQSVTNDLKNRVATLEQALVQRDTEKQMMSQDILRLQHRYGVVEDKLSRLAWVLMKACNSISSLDPELALPSKKRKVDASYPGSGDSKDTLELDEWINQLASASGGWSVLEQAAGSSGQRQEETQAGAAHVPASAAIAQTLASHPQATSNGAAQASTFDTSQHIPVHFTYPPQSSALGSFQGQFISPMASMNSAVNGATVTVTGLPQGHDPQRQGATATSHAPTITVTQQPDRAQQPAHNMLAQQSPSLQQSAGGNIILSVQNMASLHGLSQTPSQAVNAHSSVSTGEYACQNNHCPPGYVKPSQRI